MESLEQSDIDTLLASTGSQKNETPAATDPPAGRANSGQSQVRGPELPDEYKLTGAKEQLDRLMPIEIPVGVRLAERKMAVDQLLDLSVGTIIEFDRQAESDLDLVVGNVPIGTGNAVKCGENFGLRVITIQPWAQRLLAVGLIR